MGLMERNNYDVYNSNSIHDTLCRPRPEHRNTWSTQHHQYCNHALSINNQTPAIRHLYNSNMVH